MAEVLVVGSETYTGTQVAVNAALSGIGNVTLVATADNTIGSVFARTWAIANGVPFLNLGYMLPGIGFNVFNAPLAAHNISTPTNILTTGTHARTVAAATTATNKSKPLTQI